MTIRTAADAAKVGRMTIDGEWDDRTVEALLSGELQLSQVDAIAFTKDDSKPVTALMYAARQGEADLVESLVSRGADIYGGRELLHGWTPLHVACQASQWSVVTKLVALGVDLDYANPNRKGRTAWDITMDRGENSGPPKAIQLAGAALEGALELAHSGKMGMSLQVGTSVAVALARLSRQWRVEDSEAAEELGSVSTRAQLIMSALLEGLDDDELEGVFNAPIGAAVLQRALRNKLTLLLSRPAVQRYMRGMWVGPQLGEAANLLDQVGTHGERGHWMLLVCQLGIAFVMQLVLLPFLAIYPPLHQTLDADSREFIDGGKTSAASHQPTSWGASSWRNGFYSKPLSYLWERVIPSTYFLGSPVLKFWTNLLSNAALISICAALLPPRDDEAPPYATPVAIWALGAVVATAGDFISDPRAWFSDAINCIEAPGSSLALCALLLMLAGGNADLAQSFLATALVLMTLAQGLRLLMALPAYGPLVLIFLRMLRDVVSFAVLQSAVILAFAVGTHKLFNRPSYDEMYDGDDAICNEAIALFTESVWSASLMLAEMSIGTYDVVSLFGCWMTTPHVYVALAMLTTFLVISLIMLVNMLIAMMVKTFDSAVETSSVNYSFYISRNTMGWSKKPFAPMPLSLLSMPYYTVDGWLGRHGWAREGASLAQHSVEPLLSYDDISVEQLTTLVDEFIRDHQRDMVDENRPRTHLQKLLQSDKEELKSKISELSEAMVARMDEIVTAVSEAGQEDRDASPAQQALAKKMEATDTERKAMISMVAGVNSRLDAMEKQHKSALAQHASIERKIEATSKETETQANERLTALNARLNSVESFLEGDDEAIEIAQMARKVTAHDDLGSANNSAEMETPGLPARANSRSGSLLWDQARSATRDSQVRWSSNEAPQSSKAARKAPQQPQQTSAATPVDRARRPSCSADAMRDWMRAGDPYSS